MSYANHAEIGGTEYHSKYQAEAFRPFERQRKPGVLLTSLVAALALSVASGAIIVSRLNGLPLVHTDEAVGPITQYTGLQWQDMAARKSGVVHERLTVLTPPVYTNQPVFVTAPARVEKVEAEITGAEAEQLTAYLDAYPSAEARNAANAVAADIATAEAIEQADMPSAPEPRYILEDEVLPPARIVEDDQEASLAAVPDAVM